MTSTDTLQMVASPAPAAEEEWRDIPGLEGHYAASNRGRIMSFKRDPKGRVLQLTAINRNGAVPTLAFTPFMDGVKCGMTVARAVCLAFHGQPATPHLEARHLSPDLQDNRPENVRWSA